ncbi:Prenylcysteine oxidase [Coccomyxa sp. Obi]|nr:Prenylcysteine oxidase [Coccomyxa sp. Obi]
MSMALVLPRDTSTAFKAFCRFEQGEVGGRTQVFQHDGQVFEMGASIIHEENRYFREMADEMGLKRERLGGDGNEVSIFDGKQFVFNESSWTVVTLFRMLQRYGLSYFYMRQGPQIMLQRFLKLYALQAEGKAFGTPEELLQAVDLYNLTQRNFRDEIQDRIGTSAAADLFAKEFVAGINRIQYNQGNDINALAGMVSLLPTIDGRLFRIKGGNRLLPERLIRAVNASLHQGVRVTRVHRSQDGLFTLHHKSSSADELVKGRRYAAVLVATPLELTHLEITGFKVPHMPVRKYQTTVTTFVEGRLRPDHFGVEALPRGEYVMVSEDAQTPFSVIGPQKDLLNGLRIYKLFSKQPLANATVTAIFANLTVLSSREWKAYPHFSPPERFPPFQLAPGLYLNNAWENAASAMEMSAVAAKNCALLIAQYLRSMSSSNGGLDAGDSSMDGARSEL